MEQDEGVVEWTRSLLRGFIDLFRRSPCLWQMKNPLYTNKRERARAFEVLVGYLRERGVERADEQLVKTKIGVLRCTYRKELKKVKMSLKKAESPDMVHKPKLWYYHLLAFTSELQNMPEDDATDNENSGTSYEEKETFEEASNEMDMISEYISETEKISEHSVEKTEATEEQPLCVIKDVVSQVDAGPRKRGPKRKAYPRLDGARSVPEPAARHWQEVLQAATATPKVAAAESDLLRPAPAAATDSGALDEFGAMGIYFAAKIRKMAPMQQILAQSLMEKILTRGLLNRLTESTDFNLL